MVEMAEMVERLAAAAGALENALDRMSEWQGNVDAEAVERVEKIVATVDSSREADLLQRLEAAEASLAELRASAARAGAATPVRKTLPANMATMLAKQGVVVESVEAGAVDAALASLSIEQRIAVKSELMRAGLLG